MADRPFRAHVWAACSMRAMPENEKPPATPVDIYLSLLFRKVFRDRLKEISAPEVEFFRLGDEWQHILFGAFIIDP